MSSSQNSIGKLVKVRWIKEYEGAKNHICIGEVREQQLSHLVVFGRTYHFGRIHASTTQGVQTGDVKARWIPWSQIAVVTELPADLDWRGAAFKLSKEGRLVMDDRRETLIDEL